MAAYYFDSSALVKRYAQEVGSHWVSNLTDPQAGNEIFITLVTGVEIVAAIARRTRMGSIAAQDAAAGIVERTMELAECHGLRGYDAIQLASALAVQEELHAAGAVPLIFVSADDALNKIAQAEGLAVENPTIILSTKGIRPISFTLPGHGRSFSDNNG